MLKYGDEAFTLAKHSDEVLTVAKHGDELALAGGDTLKYGDEVFTMAKQGDEFALAGGGALKCANDVSEGALKVEKNVTSNMSQSKNIVETTEDAAKGAVEALDINSIKTMITSGNLDNVYKYINGSSLKDINNDSIEILFKNIDKGISNTFENINLKKTIVEKALNDGSKIDILVPASVDFLDETSGWIKWPPNDGFILELEKGNRPVKSLDVGEIIDRYGRETGNYVSPKYPPVTYEQRALPYLKNPNAYHQYEIIKPIPGVEYGEIAEAFGQCGGGIQYILPQSLAYYLDNGFIIEVFK